jgi:L-asparaginase II
MSTWMPIFTVERSGRPELVVSGIVSVVEGNANGKPAQLLALGDVDQQLWSRSLLKPWQLLSNLPLLKEAYPTLQDRHCAVISASHNAESEHLCVLRELLDMGRLSEESLKCPASMPLHAETRVKFRQEGFNPRPLFHNCSGKHIGYLLALKAQNGSLEKYLDPTGEHFAPLRNLLGALLNRSPSSFDVTTDGCRIPNYAMSAYEMASLYRSLVVPKVVDLLANVPEDLEPMLKIYGDLQKIIVAHPELVGGTARVDTNIMLGNVAQLNFAEKLVAKQGADGLLAIGIPANPKYPYGIGILIKLASGFVEKYMELIVQELFKQLSLVEDLTKRSDDSQSHIKTIFHFHIAD